MNLCFDQLPPIAKREAENCGIAWPSRNNFKSIVARAVEMIDAYEEAIAHRPGLPRRTRARAACRTSRGPGRAATPPKRRAACSTTATGSATTA